jgi:TolA-binding protein
MNSKTTLMIILLLQSCSSNTVSHSDDLIDTIETSDGSEKTGESDAIHQKTTELRGDNRRGSTQQLLDSLSLKQAKMLSRIEELEQENRRQKETLRSLELGLTLGLSPKGLENIDTSSPQALESKETTLTPVPPESPVGDDGFDAALNKAKELFNTGDIGKAYVAFASLEKDYDPSIHLGLPAYWMGRCWFQLKEYPSSKQAFEQFVSQYPQSSWAPSAKFYLARSEWELGFREM